MTEKTTADLTGVSETALLTLHSRAREAGRPDTIIEDPMAVQLLESIDYDFSRFGRTRQDFAIRALTFDRETLAYLARRPTATVVALAEGLQTSFWRVEAAVTDPQFRWLTVDLEPIVELRRRLLPASDRVELCAQSALDYRWMDGLDPGPGVFITAEGLLMYLEPDAALDLIRECAKRFPGGAMMFDLPPSWFTALARSGWLKTSWRYTVPAMPFSMSPSEAATLVDIPGVRTVRDVRHASGRGSVTNALLAATRLSPLLDPLRGVTVLLEFG